MVTRNLFFELLQLSVGTRNKLSETPTTKEWQEIYQTASEQAVVGVMANGLEHLPAEARPQKELLLEWIGTVQMIEQRNRFMDDHCLKLLRMLEKAGLRGSILKGQGIAKLYGDADSKDNLGKWRQSGDIDVYVDCEMEHALRAVREAGITVRGWDYKHAHLEIWKDVEVELHYHVEILFNLFKNKRLQKWFSARAEEIFSDPKRTENTDNRFTTPTIEFNVFYILLHIYRHFFTEGVGLRQVIDYFFVLRHIYADNTDVIEMVKAVRMFGMERFARGLMWVMREALNMPTVWMLWQPDEKEGIFILEQIVEGGNFGHYSQRVKRGRNGWNYVRNMVGHSIHLVSHYPSEALWTPLWVVWHKGWKCLKLIKIH